VLDSKPVNISLLLLLAAIPSTAEKPVIAGVLSTADASSSQWIEFDLDPKSSAKTLLKWRHARGWLPRVSVNTKENQILVSLLPEGRGHGDFAELWLYDLTNKHRRLISTGVLPRQHPLFTSRGPLYVRAHEGQMQQWLGTKLLGQWKAELWWPLEVRKDHAFVLALIDKKTKLLKLNLVTGQIQVLINWNSDPVRDFTFNRETLTYQRQLANDRFAIEQFNLISNKSLEILQFNLPHLSPVSFKQSILFSLSPSAVSGRLGVWEKKKTKEGPYLGHGAPIPVNAKDQYVVVRRQSKTKQAYFVWDSDKNQVYELPTAGQILESITFLSGRNR